MVSHSFARKSIGPLNNLRVSSFQKRCLPWLAFVALVVFTEMALHDPPGALVHYGALFHGLLLLCAVAILSLHHDFVTLNARAAKGTLLLSGLVFLASWVSSMQFLLCVEILFLTYLVRVLYGSLFALSRTLALIAIAYLSFDAVSSGRHNWREVLTSWVAAELFLRLIIGLERNRGHSKNLESLKFELRNIFNIATGGRRAFWEESFSLGQWSFLDSSEQSLRHILIAGLVTRPAPIMLLDVGCGLGTLFQYLPKQNTAYCGLDISASVTEQNRLRYSEYPAATFIASGLLEYQPSDQKYDVIVLNEVLYYLPLTQLREAIQHCAALLREPQSILLISMNKNPKAILLWELLSIHFSAETSSSVENSNTGSKWYIRTFTQRELTARLPFAN
jgi:hypothetical protein